MRRHVALLMGLLLVLTLVGCGSAQPGPDRAPVAKPAPVGQAGGQAGQSDLPSGRMIARTATLELTVGQIVPAVEAATAMTERMGGFVSSTNIRDEDDGRRVATLSLRVPAERYDEALAELRALAIEVDVERGTAQDVTEEYADLDARLRNLEATEQQYLTLLSRAESVEDVLAVQEQLTEVRTRIDQLKGRIELLQRRVTMSQIDVTMQAESATFQPFRYARTAWANSLRGIELAVGFLISTWWLWLVIGFVWWLARAIRRRRRQRPVAPVESTTAT